MMKTQAISILLLVTTASLIGQPRVRFEKFADNLQSPIAVANAADGSGRLFVTEQALGVRLIRSDGTVVSPLFLDLSDRVNPMVEGGVLGLAFHPQFAENGRLFVAYSRGPEFGLRLKIAEFKVHPGIPDEVDPETERTVIQVPIRTPTHYGGDIAFGPDGMLYISVGDGGPGGDPFKVAQDLELLPGSILRIDVDSEDGNFAIPPGNPFADGQEGRPEIWAYGFRNPFRIAFDNGRLFAGDVGQDRYEEIDLVTRGGNYGWSIVEGPACFPEEVEQCDREGLVPPIHSYDRDDGRSVSLGRVYRGPQPTSAWGSLVFADFLSHRFWTLSERPQNRWVRRDLGRSSFLPTGFGEDEQGNLYVTDFPGGALWRLVFEEVAAFPQIAAGATPAGSLRTILQLVNPGSDPIEGLLRFFTPAGQALEITLNGASDDRFQIALKPGASRTVAIESPDGDLINGWAAFISDAPLPASALFQFSDPDTGRITAQAGAAAAPAGDRFTASVSRDGSRGLDTGIAILNPSEAEAAQVTLRLASESGEVTEHITLLSSRRTALFLGEIEGVPEEFEGTLAISSSRSVAVTLLLTVDGIVSASLPLGAE